jgi:hypothetical protein
MDVNKTRTFRTSAPPLSPSRVIERRPAAPLSDPASVIDPYPAAVGRFDTALDPSHAFDTRMDIRIAQRREQCLVCAVGCVHGHGETVVKAGPGLKQSFGVSGTNAVFQQGVAMQIAHAAFEHLHRPVLDLERQLIREDEEFAYASTLDLLSSEPDLVGLYVAGGGIEGVVRTLRVLKTRKVPTPTVVCHDLTPITSEALRDGVVQAVLSHPVVALAQTAVKVMVDAAIDPSSDAGARFMLSLQIDVPESV